MNFPTNGVRSVTRLVTLPRQLRQNERAGAGRSDGQNGWGNTENRMSRRNPMVVAAAAEMKIAEEERS